MDWNLTYTKKDDGADKKIVDHLTLKVWTFFWGQGECEWSLPF